MFETEDTSGSQTDEPTECTFAEFFESKPANVIFRITDATPRIVNRAPSGVPMIVPKTEAFRVPPIHLWCSWTECDGIRIFDPDGDDDILHLSETDEKPRDRFLSFSCRNCRRRRKQYAILYSYGGDRKRIEAIKVGEHPPLSQQIPSRLRKLVGADQWHRVMPRSAIIWTRSRKLSLNVMYHLTHRMMISWSKCRPLNRSCAEVGSVIPAVIARYQAFQQFAPEPSGRPSSKVS